MTKLLVNCPKCREATEGTFREMVAYDPQTGKVKCSRRFPLCPKHGELGDEKDEIPGHHATHWNAICNVLILSQAAV